MNRLNTSLLALLACVFMAACGGGDADEDDGRAIVQPVDCKAQPERCA